MSGRLLTVLLASLPAVLLVVGCGEGDGPARGGGARTAVRVDYPLEGSVFPPDFTMPTFLWHDDSAEADRWRVVVTFPDGGKPLREISDGPPPPEREADPEAFGPNNGPYEGTPYQRSARSWTPSAETWAEIQRRAVERPATVAFEGFAAERPETVLSRGAVTLTTSKDAVGAPIFYRDVPLMPSKGESGKIAPLARGSIQLIAWRLRDVARPDSKVLLTGMFSCANCHSFSRDGNTMGMDVDGPTGDKGAYAIAPIDEVTVIGDEQVITWNSFEDKPEGHRTIGFLSRISPDGRHVVSTLNEELYVRNFTNYRFLQVFYPTRGILAWYSTETGEMKALPGADDTDYVHCQPAWTPDGAELVFARTRAFDAYPPGQALAKYAGDPNEPTIRFDLYRMPFDGGRGGTPVAIEGASGNGKSNTFPKVSPDGKWLVFTKCGNGQLIRPDSRLWIVPAKGGVAREMNCNTPIMNSWHSFSPNGRWLVFSSKSRTPYTQMFLTHIDEDGNDTPAILIPNSTAANRAVNIPEFVNRPYDEFDAIDVPAANHHRLHYEGMELLSEGRLDEAVEKLRAAVEQEPGFSRGLNALGYACIELKRYDEARMHLRKAIEVDPSLTLARVNIGLSLLREGRTARAARHLEEVVRLVPQSALAHHNLGIARLELGNPKGALRAHREAARLDPADAEILNSLGWALQVNGDATAAIVAYRSALEAAPGNAVARGNLIAVLQETGRRGDALKEMLVLVESRPDDLGLRLGLAWGLATQAEDALRDGSLAVELAERCRKEVGDRPDVLDVLAAAYAEAGRFAEAVEAAQLALRLADEGGVKVAQGLDERLQGYRARRPHRQR